MSASIIVQTNDKIYLSSDSAISFTHDGNIYRLKGKGQKVYQISDRFLMFCAGKFKMIEELLHQIKQYNDVTPSIIQKEIQQICDTEDQDVEIIMAVYDKEPIVIQLSPYNDYQLVEKRINDDEIGIYSAGIKTEEMYDCFYNLISDNFTLIDALKLTYDKYSYEGIGGELKTYELSKDGIKGLFSYNIREKNDLNVLDLKQELIFDFAHLVFADKLVGRAILGQELTIGDSDGTFDVTGNLLTIKDRSDVVRLLLGEYATNKFGLKLFNKTGQDVVLDENGILNSWQVNSADNVDSSNGLSLNIYLPSDTLSVRKALLNFKLLPFRSYSGTTASGGGSTKTTLSGGSKTTASGGGKTSSAGGSHRHTLFTETDGNVVPTPTEWKLFDVYMGNGQYAVMELPASTPGSVETYTSDGHHDHSLPDHTHDIPDHAHDIELPDHSHPISHGIYTGTTATGIKVIINGADRTTALGGSFTTDKSDLDITSYLQTGQWNEIKLTSTRLGRIDANVFLQAFMGT